MTKKNYSITEKAVADVLTHLFDPYTLGNPKNLKYLIEALMTLPEHAVSTLLSIALIDDDYIPLEIGNTVRYQPPSYSSMYDKDIMMDKGLMDNEGYIYGKVTGDGAWNKEDVFNPYSQTVTVDIYIWKDDEITINEDKVAVTELEVIGHTEVPKFNDPSRLDFFFNDDSNDVANDDTSPIDTL